MRTHLKRAHIIESLLYPTVHEALSHIVFFNHQQKDKEDGCSHFTDEETESPISEVTCPKFHCHYKLKNGFKVWSA